MRFFTIILLIIPAYAGAQLQIQLPSEIYVTINDSLFEPSESWMDSLIDESRSGLIKYEIITAHRNGSFVQTKVRIPQFFSIPEIVRQVIYYYALLGDEHVRKYEQVHIYPFFTSTYKNADIVCSYLAEGIYTIRIYRWQQVPIPGQPIPEDKYLFNLLVDAAVSQLDKKEDIPDVIYEKVSRENNISIKKLRDIYQRVKLWQMAQN